MKKIKINTKQINFNPIYHQLKELNLIKKSRLIVINNKTRDKKIRVFKDLKTKIIFLEKFITNNYYSSPKKKLHDKKLLDKIIKKKMNKKNAYNHVQTLIIEDDIRRASQFKKILKNKEILDFGCGWGGFLSILKDYKSLYGLEQRKECVKYIQSKYKKISMSDNINSLNKKFDIITAFHVLEHVPYQLDTLKILHSKLKNKGKIIIEVPHAEDFLILQDELKEFKNFIFWSQHLILHTHNSLKTMLSNSGFKNIKIEFYQRHNFANHFGWFLNKKPGGHNVYKNLFSEKINKYYCENLKQLNQSDTLIAIAEKS